jgi:trk system potassium uptake protein
MSIKTVADFSPGRTILLSLFITIAVGTALLALPIARLSWIHPIDLFFTATSVTCVCGLFTVPIDQFTPFGHAIILALIQIGGLGLITMTLFLMSLFINLGMATQFMAGQLLELESATKLKRLLIFIISLTLALEFLGACSIFIVIKDHFPLGTALFLACFQSISSFCNAGISLFPAHQFDYQNSYTILMTSSLLMLCGGLGFITWQELVQYARAVWSKKRHILSLYSRIVLYWSASLLTICSIIFWILERDNVLTSLSTPAKITSCLFHAISFKSAGLLIVDPTQLQLASLLLIMVSSVIGSAPGSTGSGIKITTLAVFLSSIKAAIAGKASTDIRGRHIPMDQVYKSVAIVFLSVTWIVLTTFCLLITEKAPQFLALLFEASSAFTTLGVSLGVTASLSTIGKIFIILSMVIGRIGSITLLLALRKRRTEPTGIKYPEERIMLG